MKHTVLLVDDDSNVLHCLRRMLQEQPYQLYTARSGEEAAGMLKARSVDVIVADERMPRMSGTDLLAWAAKNYPEVVRIMLTGHALEANAARVINEGGVYYLLTKPCNEAHLVIVIRRALEHKERLAQQKQLLEISARQAGDRERFARDLEALDRLIARDLKRPLRSIARSCQSLLEQHNDLFDHGAQSLIEGTLDAISDMQLSIDDLLGRMRVHCPDGSAGQCCAGPNAAVTA